MSAVIIFDAKLKEERGYWLKRLAGVPATATMLDLDREPVSVRPPAAAPLQAGIEEQRLQGRLDYCFDAALTANLRRLTGPSPFLLYTLLVSGLKVCLSRYADAAEVAVGSPPLTDCDHANALVIVDEVRNEETFRDFLMRVRQSLLDAYANQHYPYQRLIKELASTYGRPSEKENSEGIVLFDVAVELKGFHGRLAEAGEGLRLRFEEEIAEPDDRKNKTVVSGGLSVSVEYDMQRYSRNFIAKFLFQYEEILRVAAVDASRQVGELEMLSVEERRLLIVDWNQTEKEYAPPTCLHQLFEAQVERSPEAIALEFHDEQISYRVLNTLGNQLACYLRQEGVGPESRVGILIPRSAEMVIALLGVLKAGGAYVPLEPTYPQERLRFILQDAAIELLLTQQQLLGVMPKVPAKVVCMDGDWSIVAEQSVENLAPVAEAANLAYVIYTSGSMGQPKGVMVSHRGLVNYLHWSIQAYGVTEGSWSAVHSPLSFDLTVTSLWTPLMAGGRVALLPEEEGIEGLAKALGEQRQFSLIKLTPSHLEALGQTVRPERMARQTRTFVVGGEALQGKILGPWREQEPELRVINEYGPTEAVVGCCAYEQAAGAIRDGDVPIGRPISNTQLYILDRRLEPVGIGARGELYIGGEGVTRGYLRRAELTGERFIPHPHTSVGGARLYRTGDLARHLPGGEIEYLGRKDRQVKVRGYRVELGEIEAVLTQHKQVKESVVVAEGEDGGRRLVAYVVAETLSTEAPGEQEQLNGAVLREYLRTRLPDYLIPAIYVLLDHLPLTPNGKVDHKALPRLRQERGDDESAYLIPHTPVEEILIGIFGEVLKLDRVGINDNFFELGGHSLLATQVVSRVRNTFEVEIGVGSVFKEPTVRGLARKIEEAARDGEKGEAPPLVRAPRVGRAPLSFAQQRLWFIEQLEPGNAAYNCPGAVRLEGELGLEALESVINGVVRRHEALRTRIEDKEGEPAQVIEPWEPRGLEVKDLTNLTKENREEVAREIAREEAVRGFDLSNGPLIRVKVLKLGEEEHVVLFTMHHIVSDAWSMGVLVREVCALYEAISEGRESPLRDLEIQYADYAYWQRQYLTGAVLERHLAYWKKQLGGRLPTLELPTDHPRPLVPSYRGGSKSFPLSTELSQSLRALSRRESVTLFIALLAAFKTLLYRYTGQEDIIIGTSAENRNRAEIEPLIGFFVNSLPIRTDLSGNPRFRELLRRVKDVALSGYAHQDLPFERMVEEIQPERAVWQMPLFNVAFGVQNAPSEELKLKDINVRPMIAEPAWARFDLAIWIIERLEKVQVSWIYSKDLFEEETIIRIHDHFETLLLSAVDRPDARLTALEISPKAEVRLSQKEEGGWEGSDIVGPVAIKRKAVNLPIKPV